MLSIFTPGTPLYNEEGSEILKGARNLDVARRLLKESGYAGQPVTILAAQDIPFVKAWGDVITPLLTSLGIKVDLVATDWGSVVARRARKSPPGQGGWHAFFTWALGAAHTDPSGLTIRANGQEAFFGWPSSPQVETEVMAWLDANTFEEEIAAARRMNKAAIDHVIQAPLGFFLQHQAWRKTVTGITKGPMPFFWGVSKTA
jgi:peptide/nickel transport system substrate-binding protein